MPIKRKFIKTFVLTALFVLIGCQITPKLSSKPLTLEVQKYMFTMELLHNSQRQSDINLYGKKIITQMQDALYDPNLTGQDALNNLAAYNNFISIYPDSYAANILLFDRLLNNQLDLNETKSLYLKHKNNIKFLDAVHNDMKPSLFLQLFLAENYLSNNELSKANAILSDMKRRSKEQIFDGNNIIYNFSDKTKKLLNLLEKKQNLANF